MKESYTSKRRVRRNFGRIDAVSDMQSLIEVQTGSYADFIESDKEKGQCEFGLEEVFKSILPLKIFQAAANWSLSNTNSKSRNMMLTSALSVI